MSLERERERERDCISNKSDDLERTKSILEGLDRERLIRVNFKKEFPEIYKVLLRIRNYGHKKLFEDNVLELGLYLKFAKEIGHDNDVINNVDKCVDFIIKDNDIKNGSNKKLFVHINIETAEVSVIDGDHETFPLKYVFKTK